MESTSQNFVPGALDPNGSTPTPEDRQHFIDAVRSCAGQAHKVTAAKRKPAKPRMIDLAQSEPVAGVEILDRCQSDRSLMRVCTYMLWSSGRGFTTEECATSLGIAEDVVEKHLETIWSAGLTGKAKS